MRLKRLGKGFVGALLAALHHGIGHRNHSKDEYHGYGRTPEYHHTHRFPERAVAYYHGKHAHGGGSRGEENRAHPALGGVEHRIVHRLPSLRSSSA